MTKPKHPTARTIRSGQTVYGVGVIYSRSHKEYVVEPLRIGKRSDIGEGNWTTQVTAAEFRHMLDGSPQWLHHYFFYSRRKAERMRRRLTLEWAARLGPRPT